MGLFKAIGKGLKGLTKVASFVPGPIGMVASAGNAALNGKNIGKSVVGDLARNSKGAAAILPLAMTGGAAGVAGGAGAAGAAGGLGGLIQRVGMGALKNPDLIAGGLSMLQGMRQQGQANKLADRALALREQQYADFAPIRRVGLEGMQRTQRPDLSAVFRNSQNPFA